MRMEKVSKREVLKGNGGNGALEQESVLARGRRKIVLGKRQMALARREGCHYLFASSLGTASADPNRSSRCKTTPRKKAKERLTRTDNTGYHVGPN